MDYKHELNRRDFIHLTAVAADGAMLAACGRGGDGIVNLSDKDLCLTQLEA